MNKQFLITKVLWNEEQKCWRTFEHIGFSRHVARLFVTMGYQVVCKAVKP